MATGRPGRPNTSAGARLSLVVVAWTVVGASRPLACSESTCSTLGWVPSGAFSDGGAWGTPGVCGESDTRPLNGCSGLLSLSDAATSCESIGARLCSRAEIEADETRGTGCNYDDKYIWTHDTCFSELAGGFRAVIGATYEAEEVLEAGGEATVCLSPDDAATAYARCCADEHSCSPTLAPTTDTPAPTPAPSHSAPTHMPQSIVACSQADCAFLGWQVHSGAEGDSKGVCGASAVSGGNGVKLGGGCSGTATWEEAKDMCEVLEGRLCTASEVGPETLGTGCGYNDSPIWSASSCGPDSYYQPHGRPGSGKEDWACVAKDDAATGSVRCCADVSTCNPTPAPTTPEPTHAPHEPSQQPTPPPTAHLHLGDFKYSFVDKDRLEVAWATDSTTASKIDRFELRLTNDNGNRWATEYFTTKEVEAETYVFTGLTCNTKYRTKVRAVMAAEDLTGPTHGQAITNLHSEVYSPWFVTPWQRLLPCYVAASPGGFNGLTLKVGNFANRNSLQMFWQPPTDDTNLDYYEIRYRVSGSTGEYEYTKARPKALGKVLYGDQHGTECGTEYEVGIRASGGQGDWAKGAWVNAVARTAWCPPPTRHPTAGP